MRARDIVVPQATVTMQDSVADAVRIMAIDRLPGLVVVDDEMRPLFVLPGTQVLRMAILDAYQQDTSLVRTIDEAHADLFWQEVASRTVGQCVPSNASRAGTVTPDATLLEVAASMARTRSPLVAVVDGARALAGVITLNGLLINLRLPDGPS